MPRKNVVSRELKASRSKKGEPDAETTQTPILPQTKVGDNVDQKLSLTKRGDSGESKNSLEASENVESAASGLSPPLRQSTRKRPASISTPESLPSSSSSKKPRPSKGYAPPSTYAHLKGLTDTITPNLICLFVGLNPGIQTATFGHPYAHPSNHYWRLLHSSGLTPDRQLAPGEYVKLPKEYSLGNTNLVDRATRNGAELSKEEMVEGGGVLDEKIRKGRPEVVCFVGKSIWESVWKWKYGKKMKASEFKYGFQDLKENLGKSGETEEGKTPWEGARVFVATTTSALAATMSMEQKQEIWRQLGEWVEKRREEKGGAEGSKE